LEPAPTTTETISPAATRRGPALMLLMSDLGFGGAERQTMQLAHLLADRHPVVVAYLKAEGMAIQAESPVAAAIRRERARLAGVICFDVQRRIDFAAVGRMAKAIEMHRVQLVLCANTFPLLYAQLARWRLGRPLRVLEVYHTTVLRSLGAQARLVVYRPLFWLAHQLVYVCEWQRRYCRRRLVWSPRTAVIHNGIDPARFDPARLPSMADARARFGLKDEDRVVGLCAVFRPEKAHEDLLEAVARCKARGIDWQVLLIGDGPTRPAVEAAIERLGLSSQVHITGFLEDVREAVLACDAMALVSISETFSVAALEAMALAKPLLMSDIGGAAEQIEPGINGELFPPSDLAALADRLARLADRERCAAMGRASREKLLREFSEDAMRRRYEAVIDALLGGPEDGALAGKPGLLA
jgi:glycosyltransferase involved in cell wall biosynthesis